MSLSYKLEYGVLTILDFPKDLIPLITLVQFEDPQTVQELMDSKKSRYYKIDTEVKFDELFKQLKEQKEALEILTEVVDKINKGKREFKRLQPNPSS
jgi:hypothetical protein